MRSLPYTMNDSKDFSMLTHPKLHIGDTVIVWDKEEVGEWAQARVVDAMFNRHAKEWEYSAVTEFVDFEEYKKDEFKEKDVRIKDWYYFDDNELEEAWIGNDEGQICLDHYIVIKK